MAFRSTGWKNITNRLRTYTTATVPKPKAYAPAADPHRVDHPQSNPRPIKGEFVPVYVAIGLIVLQFTFGLHTVYQQLANAPGVKVRKKTRETLTEVEDPDLVTEQSRRFLDKSWFRKVAHVQEFDGKDNAMPVSMGKDAYAHRAPTLSLKDVGVDPKFSASRASS